METGLLNLSFPSVDWVTEKLQAAANSPLKARPANARPSTAAERAAAAERELAGRGITLNGTPPAGPEAASYRDALTVLAQPEALVRLRIAAPGEETSDVALLVRDGMAALYLPTDTGVGVGHARPLEALVQSFAEDAVHNGPLAGQQILLWPAVLKLLTLVWGAGQDAEAVVPRAEAERRLAAQGVAADKGREALDQLVQTGILVAAGDALAIVREYRPFLQRVWSGYAFQVEYLPLAGAPSFEVAVRANGPHLLFMGPPGDRILNDILTGEALKKWLKGARPTEDKAVRLAAPARDVVEKVLRILLGLQKA